MTMTATSPSEPPFSPLSAIAGGSRSMTLIRRSLATAVTPVMQPSSLLRVRAVPARWAMSVTHPDRCPERPSGAAPNRGGDDRRRSRSLQSRAAMSLHSDPFFRTFHALRIKGFAKAEVVAEVADLPLSIVRGTPGRPAGSRVGDVPRGPTAVAAHPGRTRGAQDGARRRRRPPRTSPRSCTSRTRCSSASTSGSRRCAATGSCKDGAAQRPHRQPRTTGGRRATGRAERRGRCRWSRRWRWSSSVSTPTAPVWHRRASAWSRGETNMFTGVMCGSYHDVWMELHEDLILTQGIDRSAEGSF